MAGMEGGGGGGGGHKDSLTSFPPVTSTNVGISLNNQLLTFSFNHFVKFGQILTKLKL